MIGFILRIVLIMKYVEVDFILRILECVTLLGISKDIVVFETIVRVVFYYGFGNSRM